MPISVKSQTYIFLWSIIGGALIALIYDLFRIKRKAIRTGVLAIYFEDLIYWIIVAVVMFAIVYYSNEGEIRGYIFIGTVLGVTLYALFFSKLVMTSAIFIIRMVVRILKTIWKILTYPFRLIFKILSYPAKPIARAARKTYKGARAFGRGRVMKAKIWSRRFRNVRKKI